MTHVVLPWWRQNVSRMGGVRKKSLSAARFAAQAGEFARDAPYFNKRVVNACRGAAMRQAFLAAISASTWASSVEWAATCPPGGTLDTRAPQCALLRDIVGNPFRTTTIDPDWGAWNDGIVLRIAQAIYEERAFDRMPILGDALENAGCAERAILDHLRSLGPHVRGCWVLDLVLGKA
jgi:hypothetical protein